MRVFRQFSPGYLAKAVGFLSLIQMLIAISLSMLGDFRNSTLTMTRSRTPFKHDCSSQNKRCNRNGVNKKYEKWRYISLIKSMVWVIYKQRLTIEKWIREEKGEGRWLENLHKAHERERRIIEDKEWEKAKGVRGRWNTQRHTTGEGKGKWKKHTREGARGQKDSQIKKKHIEKRAHKNIKSAIKRGEQLNILFQPWKAEKGCGREWVWVKQITRCHIDSTCKLTTATFLSSW